MRNPGIDVPPRRVSDLTLIASSVLGMVFGPLGHHRQCSRLQGLGPHNRPERASKSPPVLEDASNISDGPRDVTHWLPIHYGRPSVDSLVAQAAEELGSHQSSLIMGCGPNGVLQKLGKSATSRMTPGGPQLSLADARSLALIQANS
ncbi:hypothetical protein B0J13DRAFT_532237 [Dactylonectria estremocensis]|uniref:Ferric reductase NAD binding domain-containing protein n=1 Tax=Dactylonectria estremocensis TaxID=1079267 RepID=A0A9P9II31_9HYPO|nr:hypothetical protein B0J13DRAFT_532237 [Dactylonectria estremocensis]